MLWLGFAVVIICIIVGARLSGVAMGFSGGAGLLILVFIFGLKPSSPPVDVLLIILAVGGMAATLQAAGGLDYLVSIAEKILRRAPNRITIMGPVVTFFFTVFTGTSYVALAVFPVISEVALDAKVRGERPMSISLIASQHGISASPVSASTATLVALLAGAGLTLGQVMLVAVPSIFLAVLLGAFAVYKKGVDLENDPIFQAKVASGEIKLTTEGRKKYSPTREAKLSVAIFAVAIIAIVILGSFKSLLPNWQIDGKTVTLSIPHTIEMIGLAASCLIVLACRVKPSSIATNSVFSAGMTGVIAIFGIAWMTDTFFLAHKATFIAILGELVQAYPWLFAFALFFMAALLLSQGATTRSLMPVGISLGIPMPFLVAMAPAVNGLFFIPATGSAIAAMTFDRSGTTRIGSFILNHSFMLPGIITCAASVIIGFGIASLVF